MYLKCIICSIRIGYTANSYVEFNPGVVNQLRAIEDDNYGCEYKYIVVYNYDHNHYTGYHSF